MMNVHINPEDLGLSEAPVCAALDLDEIAKVLRRHAIAAAFVKLSYTKWVPDKDLVVRFFSWGQPGTHEVEVPTRSELYPAAENIFSANLSRLRRYCQSTSPGEIVDFMADLSKQTVDHRRSMAQMFNESHQINGDITDEAAWTTDKLFAIKVGADVVFNGAMVLSGAGLFASVGGGALYSMTTQLAMTRHELSTAEILAFASSMGSALVPTLPSAAGSTVSGMIGDYAIGQAKASLNSVKLGISADAATKAASQTGGWAGANSVASDVERTLPKGHQLKGRVRPGLSGAKGGLKHAIGAAQGLGFVASMYFLKDDIAKAMVGYSSTLGSAN